MNIRIKSRESRCRLRRLFVLAAASVAPWAAAAGQPAGQDIVLTHAKVITGQAPVPIPDVTILIRDGRIKIISRDNPVITAQAETYDLQGKFVMPGLIDAHVHIGTFAAARRALLSGVTTVRSMGVSNFADVGLRALAAAGKIDAPEILAAGYHVRPKPADAFFMNHPELGDLMATGVHGVVAIKRMAETLLGHDLDWLKVNATARAGLPETDPRQPYYSEAELRALVEAGAARGIPVAAHAHGDEGGRAAVLAGVRSIEHGTYLSEETLREMAKRGTYLVPTIAVVRDLTEPGGDYDNPVLRMRGRHMYPQIKRTATAAKRLGVKIVAATDTGYGPNSTLRPGLELEELVGLGFTPFEAIQAATTTAAALLGIETRTGRLAAGYEADLIVMERNPLEDVGAVHDLLLVMNNGKIVLNRLSW